MLAVLGFVVEIPRPIESHRASGLFDPDPFVDGWSARGREGFEVLA